CRDHELADRPTIVAALMRDMKKPATSEQRRRLQVEEHDTVAFRHVQLRCGDRVLSEADNWYVGARLTGGVNGVLCTTERPIDRGGCRVWVWGGAGLAWAGGSGGRRCRRDGRGPRRSCRPQRAVHSPFPPSCSSTARFSTRATTCRFPRSTRSISVSSSRFR